MKKNFTAILYCVVPILMFQFLQISAKAQIISTVAGGGIVNNGDGGLATNALLYNPEVVFVDRIGNIYFPDNNTVRKVDLTGIVTTIAGTGVAGFSGDGGLATNAQLNGPLGIYVNPSGNIFIGSSGGFRIRKINPAGIISTFAGNEINGRTGDGALATNASIAGLQGITGDAAGNIYFTDFYNGVVRKINTSGIISTIAGGYIRLFRRWGSCYFGTA